MRRSPRVLAAWAAALLVALVTARVVATDLAALHRRSRDLGPDRTVVVAAHDLALGTRLRAADLRTTTVPERLRPAGAHTDRTRLSGRVVAVPVVAGAPVLGAHLAPRDRDGLDGLVPAGSRAVRIVPEDGLRPEPGAVVDVLASLDPSLVVEAGGGDPTLVVAEAAPVLAVDGEGEGSPAAGDDPTGIGVDARVGVTLLVTEPEAHRIAFATANGVVTLALAPPEDACCDP